MDSVGRLADFGGWVHVGSLHRPVDRVEWLVPKHRRWLDARGAWGKAL